MVPLWCLDHTLDLSDSGSRGSINRHILTGEVMVPFFLINTTVSAATVIRNCDPMCISGVIVFFTTIKMLHYLNAMMAPFLIIAAIRIM